MMQVGLTGNVASGKSTVARLWESHGIPVVNADTLAREAARVGGPAEAEIRAAFGNDVYDEDGTLDRDRVRDVVFRDPQARRRLESILHPRIRSLREAWLADRRREGATIAVSEIPLLFESGLPSEFDVVVVVHASEAARLRRLVSDRGLAEDEAHRIIRAQADPEPKRSMADFVILNDGTLEELETEALEVLDALHTRAAQGRRE